MSLSTDGAKPGDQVQVTIDNDGLKGDARIESGAFGGTVNLTPEPGFSGWHGTATVTANAKPGYYRVDGYLGNRKIDSLKFGIADTPAAHHDTHQTKRHAVAPVRHIAVTPRLHSDTLSPTAVDGRRIPKGAVDAGASDASGSGFDTGLDTGLVMGAAALSAAVLLGGTVLWRRRGDHR